MKARLFGASAGLALTLVANAPARAQFMTPYPVIVPPPPAQNLVIPKPPKPAPPKQNPPADAAPPASASNQGQCFSGRVRTCP